MVIDLGATAKGVGSDRSAGAALNSMDGGGVLVSLGGDLAVGARAPRGMADPGSEDPFGDHGPSGHVVRFRRGGMATSSVVCRSWRRGNRTLHHIIDRDG